jgi:hypothetical protein
MIVPENAHVLFADRTMKTKFRAPVCITGSVTSE